MAEDGGNKMHLLSFLHLKCVTTYDTHGVMWLAYPLTCSTCETKALNHSYRSEHVPFTSALQKTFSRCPPNTHTHTHLFATAGEPPHVTCKQMFEMQQDVCSVGLVKMPSCSNPCVGKCLVAPKPWTISLSSTYHLSSISVLRSCACLCFALWFVFFGLSVSHGHPLCYTVLQRLPALFIHQQRVKKADPPPNPFRIKKRVKGAL